MSADSDLATHGGTAGDEHVWFLPGGDLLPVALGAALTVFGWHAMQGSSEESLANASTGIDGTKRLVLVADSVGRLPDLRAASAGGSRPFVVAVGGRGAFSALADAVERRVASAVLNADQPFVELVTSLDQALRVKRAACSDAELATLVRERVREARWFGDLTSREQHVLFALFAGLSATEIAHADQVSLPTIRSHIRSILSKLGVSSQLAAVAMAIRSCSEPAFVDQLRKIHQF